MAIVIIDYGSGNLKSIANMLDKLGVEYLISSNPDEILGAERLIFPGQGHFKQAMENLYQKGLVDVIKQAIDKNIPFLGICLGLQILFEKSEEAPNVNGLGILKGEVKKFQSGKIPQIGWNKVSTKTSPSLLENDWFYFVNSYYVVPQDKTVIYSTTNYDIEFCSAIHKNNLTAVQFHPEKSAEQGLNFFTRWLES